MVVTCRPSVTAKEGQRFVVSFEGDSSCLVRVGDLLDPSTTVFDGRSSEILQAINLGKELGVDPRHAKRYVLKTDGEIIDRGDVVSRRTIAMGTVERVVKSQHDGRISMERISSGVLDIRAPFSDASVPAGVHGRVSRIFPDSGGRRKIEIEVAGYVAKPFLCKGRSVAGRVMILKDGTSVYRPSDVDGRCRDMIVVAGRSLSLKLYESLIEAGTKAVIVGGMPLTEFRVMESAAVPIFVSEGWGIAPINTVLLNLLKEHEGDFCFLDIERKHLVICPSGEPLSVGGKDEEIDVGLCGVEKGQTVQVWDMPYWGYSGKVMQVLEDEGLVQVIFDSGKKVVVDAGSVVVISEEL